MASYNKGGVPAQLVHGAVGDEPRLLLLGRCDVDMKIMV